MLRVQWWLVFMLGLLAVRAAGAELTLVEDGRPVASIVVSAPVLAKLNADQQRRREPKPEAAGQPAAPPLGNAAAAARELQDYLRKISDGAELAIVGDDQRVNGPRVLVGRSKATHAITGLDIPTGQTTALREEGFVLRCEGDTLVLAGNDDGPYYGTRYAVCELLERLGVRWIMPGEFGEIVPRSRTIRVPEQSVVQRPSFAIRNVVDDPEWRIHNKLNTRIAEWCSVGDNSLAGGRIIKGYLGGPEVFQQHPEWFALNEDGKTRNPRLVCMSSPGAVRLVADQCKADARAGKSANSYEKPYSRFAPDDGEPRCYCPDCQRRSLGLNEMISDERSTRPGAFSISQEWFHFVNEVMREVNAEYPKWTIATNGYANRDVPPEIPGFNAAKNLIVMYANIYACTLHAWDDPHCWQNQRQGQQIRRWCELSDKVWLYQYNYTMLAGKGTPTPTLARIAHNIKLAKQWGVWGFCEENADDRLTNGLMERYLRAKLYWDADADPNAVLDDLCARWYGPAAKPMRAFYDALAAAIEKTTQHGHEEPILPPVYTPALMAELDKHIRAAESLAVEAPVSARVRVERLIYDHLSGYVALEKAKRQGDYRQALKHIDEMMVAREKIRAITPFILSRHPRHPNGIPVYGDIVGDLGERPVLERRLAQLEGPLGERVALLPEQARFRTDPRDDGYPERWYQPTLDDSSWQTISTASGWESQGLPGMLDERGFGYKGAAWYRLSVEIPTTVAAGKRVMLAIPSVLNRALVWVNGNYAGASDLKNPWFRPNPAEFDVSAFIEPGKPNQITLRVFCNETIWGANGIYERTYMYSPNAAAPASNQ
jgi:hypothetical protein